MNRPRQFARSAAPAPKNTDSNLWTETPAERQQRLADEVSGKRKRVVNAEEAISPEEALEARKKRKRDENIRKGVDEHTVRVSTFQCQISHRFSSAKFAGPHLSRNIPGAWPAKRMRTMILQKLSGITRETCRWVDASWTMVNGTRWSVRLKVLETALVRVRVVDSCKVRTSAIVETCFIQVLSSCSAWRFRDIACLYMYGWASPTNNSAHVRLET